MVLEEANLGSGAIIKNERVLGEELMELLAVVGNNFCGLM